jgi:hypothetical protein
VRRLARLIIALGLALTVGPVPAQQPTPRHASIATLEILDVGQGDSILIRSPEGKTALIDAGPSRHVVELLRDRGIKSLDLVVVSHHHADHYGGMAAVIREFRPRVFLASGSSHTTPLTWPCWSWSASGESRRSARRTGPAASSWARSFSRSSPRPQRTVPRRTTTRSGFGSSMAPARPYSPAMPRSPSAAGGSGRSPISARAARCSNWPITAAVTGRMPAGSTWFGPNWRWPVWVGRTYSAIPVPRPSPFWTAGGFPSCGRTGMEP